MFSNRNKMKGFTLMVVFAFATSAAGMNLKPGKYFDIEKDVQINLYTLKNPTEPQILLINDTNSIHDSNFNHVIPTRIFIHGFQSKGELRDSLIEAYFTKGKKNVNLIEINWEKASKTFNYLAASRYVEKIGTRAALFVDFMVENKMMELSDLTVIGFSLGAHCAGFTGKRVRSGKLTKIIGLDPAFPLFSLGKPDERLDSQDAIYVETIQTSKLGFFDPLGIVSFYPNGGRSQPGCNWDLTGKCSHQTAYKYFAESIHSKQPLQGYYCDSLIDIKIGNCTAYGQKTIMGGEPGAKQQPAGIYYITIASEAQP